MTSANTDKKASRWHAIFRLLSLDCALSLWEQMGLDLKEDEQRFVQHAARLAHLIFQDGARNYYDANYSKVDSSINVFGFSLSVYRGEHFRQQVTNWCERDFIQVDSLSMTVEEAWKVAFIKLAKNYPELNCPLELHVGKVKWLVHRVENLCLFDERLTNFIDACTAGKKTTWDQTIYESSLSPEWEEPKLKDETTFYALLDASNVIQKRVLKKLVLDIWIDLKREFTDEEIDKLIKWYKCDMKSLFKMFPGLDAVPTMS
jgi:hypothetical protein